MNNPIPSSSDPSSSDPSSSSSSSSSSPSSSPSSSSSNNSGTKRRNMKEETESNRGGKGKGIGRGSGPPLQKRSRKNEINLTPPEYHFDFEKGLRYVKPYYFVHECHAKERWIGRTIAEVFSTEFFAYTKDYYIRAIESGRITINNSCVTPSTLIQREDWIQHRLHRHEPPVAASSSSSLTPHTPSSSSSSSTLSSLSDTVSSVPSSSTSSSSPPSSSSLNSLSFVSISDSFLVLDKPSSIPVHPCGRWRHNSILHILEYSCGYKREELHPVHRLDRLTSGILVIARNPQLARDWAKQMGEGKVKKQYLCRVIGDFPGDGNDIPCDLPIDIFDYKNSLMHCIPSGKPARTMFRKLSYHSATDTSLVSCHPEMGRKHQIRVHLKALGHPIANDPLYNERYRTALGISFDDLDENDDNNNPLPAPTPSISSHSPSTSASSVPSFSSSSSSTSSSTPPPTSSSASAPSSAFSSFTSPPSSSSPDYDPLCQDCQTPRNDTPRQLGIWLHAWTYKGDTWHYETKKPDWASDGFHSSFLPLPSSSPDKVSS